MSGRRLRWLTRAAALAALALPLACSSSDSDRAQPAVTTRDRSANRSDDPPGAHFEDPQGSYEIVIGDTWRRTPSNIVAEVEAWKVGPASGGFAPNVNVLVQDFTGISAQAYINLSKRGAGAEGLEAAEVTTTATGERAARFIYALEPQPGTSLRALSIAVVGDNVAVLATLTTREDDFDRLSETIEPYLRTLTRRAKPAAT